MQTPAPCPVAPRRVSCLRAVRTTLFPANPLSPVRHHVYLCHCGARTPSSMSPLALMPSFHGRWPPRPEVLSKDVHANILVASHNEESVKRTISTMKALGISADRGVYFGQLLGMADHLTFTLGQHGYKAYKYVPYGPIHEVLPYLIRRAQENSDLLGGVAAERGMLFRELLRRLVGRSAVVGS